MSPQAGRRAIITAAVVVAGVRLWMQVRGKAKTPFGEWAAGWGALFFALALVSEASPQAAGMLAYLVATADVLTNGVSLFGDITNVVSGTVKPGQVLTPTPFATQPQTSGSAPTIKPA